MNQTLLRAVQKAKKQMQAVDSLAPSALAEYDALEDKLVRAREAWGLERGSLEEFYDAHKADIDRLSEMHSLAAMGRRITTPKAPEGIAVLNLQLDASTHADFKAYCKKRRTTMAAMLRAYVLRCLEAP